MLVIEANQYEFEQPDSEQQLVLASAGRHEFSDESAFLRACPGASSTRIGDIAPISFSTLNATVAANVGRFHGRGIAPNANTIVLTLGYNRIITPDLSFDISARFVDSEAKDDDSIGYERTIVRASLLGRF